MQPQTPAARSVPLAPRPPPRSVTLDHLPIAAHGPPLTVVAVARRLGIAAATLRTWDRRYGVGPADHTPGQHRRYGVDDLARLDLMRQALLRGATAAAAAEYALTTALPHLPTAPADTSTPETVTADAGPPLPLPGGGRRARGLARAATALNAEAVRGLLNDSIRASGAQITWDVVVRPVLGAIARRWAETGTGIEVEHLLSECITAVFSALAASTATPDTSARRARPVLLAGMAGDQHRLPLIVLSATLAQRGVTCRSLGTDLPVDALRAAIRRIAPAAVLLWSQLSDTADPGLLDALPRTRPGFRTFVAGPGWAGLTLRPQIVRLTSLEEATDVISAQASG